MEEHSLWSPDDNWIQNFIYKTCSEVHGSSVRKWKTSMVHKAGEFKVLVKEAHIIPWSQKPKARWRNEEQDAEAASAIVTISQINTTFTHINSIQLLKMTDLNNFA